MTPSSIKTVEVYRYVVVGLLGTLTHYCGLAFFVEIAHLDPVISSIIAFIFTLLLSYFLNHYWTFQSNLWHSQTLPKYILVSIMGLLINIAIMYLTAHLLRWDYQIGFAFAVIVVPISNFLLNKYWSFR